MYTLHHTLTLSNLGLWQILGKPMCPALPLAVSPYFWYYRSLSTHPASVIKEIIAFLMTQCYLSGSHRHQFLTVTHFVFFTWANLPRSTARHWPEGIKQEQAEQKCLCESLLRQPVIPGLILWRAEMESKTQYK